MKQFFPVSLKYNLSQQLKQIGVLLLFFFFSLGFLKDSIAACGGTTRTWDGSNNTNWNQNANWSGNAFPTTGQNALIVSEARVPRLNTNISISCFELTSGSINYNVNSTQLTITGDYYKSLSASSSVVGAATSFTLLMAGTGAQTLEVVDPFNTVTVSNNSSVTFTNPFTIRTNLNLTGSTTTLYINDNLNLSNTTNVFTIPAGVTVEVGAGAVLTAAGGITVNGILTIKPGASLRLGNTKTLSVASGGLLNVQGSSGNAGSITADSGTFSFNVAGTISADYFLFSKMTTAGLNVTGTISGLDHGDFQNIASSGYAVTLGAAANVPSVWNSIGFFDTSGFGNNKNINANSFNVSTFTVDNWTGIGGATYEADSNGRINWGTEATTKMVVANSTASGNPTASTGQGVGPNLFLTLGFSLTKADTATNITQLKISNGGTAITGDFSSVQIHKDVNSNCVYDSGTDTILGTAQSMSGSPATATFTISSGEVSVASTSNVCVFVLVTTSGSATNANTIQMQVTTGADITNSFGYALSEASTLPVAGSVSTISGDALKVWDGSSSTAWATNNNWSPSGVPTSILDCRVGAGARIPALTANQSCQNTTLQNGGTLNFSSGAWQLNAFGSLTVDSGFTFQNASTGNLRATGATNQSISVLTTFPGNLVIANSGTAPNNVVSTNGNVTITGNLTVTSGVFRITNGTNVTISGSVTVANTATLEIVNGGTLTLANGSVVTVDTGGTLSMIGNSGSAANMTSTSTSNAYTVVINGTIKAQYYSISRLGANGVTINSGATIDATYKMQDGTFSYPVSNNTRMLRLFKKIPGDAITGLTFSLNGSAATGYKNIYIDSSLTAGTLSVSSHSGDFTGSTYDDDGGATYVLSWSGETNTIDLTQNSTSSGSLNQGSSYTMGAWGFKQTTAGAGFSDTDITSLKVTLTGTGTASDVTQARIYYSSSCATSGGTLIGTGSFSGNPGTITFSSISGATVQASAGTPPTRCIYIVFDISGSATNGATLGVQIAGSNDMVNSQTYSFNPSAAPPINLGSPRSIVGTTTTWNGSVSTDWANASNWSGGLPTSSLNCTIPNLTNDPILGSGTGSCKSINITTGILNVSSGATLDIYGDFTSTGTFTNSGTLRLVESSAINQTLTSSSSLGVLQVSKTSGGQVLTGGSLTIGSLALVTGNTSTTTLQNGHTVTLTNGVTVTAGTLTMNGGSTLRMPNGQSILVNGGTFNLAGTADAYPQSTSNKARITNAGSGTWGLSVTSGSLGLTGFILDFINTSGVNLSGSSSVSSISGGQFTNLSNSYSSVRAFQFNNSGSIPATASNVGWNWGSSNSPPGAGESYLLASSTGCSNQSISFDEWFGDFYTSIGNPDSQTKVSASNCTITIAASASPVQLTRFEASAYDAAIAVTWKTGLEFLHSGFNIYRSTDAARGFVQINSSLIRNTYTSGQSSGDYIFIDTDVSNDETYYYILEDFSNAGIATRHGPISVTPKAGWGAPPAPNSGVNQGDNSPGGGNSNSPGSGNVVNGSLADLGYGVHLLAQTQNSMRLQIIPPPGALSVSSWNPSYRRLSVPGYSSSQVVGTPELVERKILIELPSNPRSIHLIAQNVVTAASVAGVLMQPAPSYTLSGAGVLSPNYSVNAAAYATSALDPQSHFVLSPTAVTISGKSYLELLISPYRYNPAAQELLRADRITLDLAFDGTAWSRPPALIDPIWAPAALENSLRIKYERGGVFTLSYEDLESAGLEGPWAGVPMSDWRLFYRGTEIPMQVSSPSGNFQAGDSVRFLAPYERSIEDAFDEIVITTAHLSSGTNPPLRIDTMDGNPASGIDSSVQSGRAIAQAEQDNLAVFNFPLGSNVERFYWGGISKQNGSSDLSNAFLEIPIGLPNLSLNSSRSVRIKVWLTGGKSDTYLATHQLGLYLNSNLNLVSAKTFIGETPQVVEFLVPNNALTPDENILKFEALAGFVSPGKSDLIFIDRVEVEYEADWVAVNNQALVEHSQPGNNLVISGFSDPSLVEVWDITNLDNMTRVSGVLANFPVNGSIQFRSRSDLGGNFGKKFFAFQPSSLLPPAKALLGMGYATSLKSPQQQADFIVIGTQDLISAAKDLIVRRSNEGLLVKPVTYDQIFAEFSDGRRSSEALREFLNFANTGWLSPQPKYVLILGDATYDPKNRFASSRNDFLPISLQKGIYLDYGSDNYFVSTENGIPFASIGRIPTSSAAELEAYIDKLMDYETGARAPELNSSKKVYLVSDKDSLSEGFDQHSQNLAATLSEANAEMKTQKIQRSVQPSDAALKTQIESAFQAGPLLLTYIGHGAENTWAAAGVFTSTDAQALTNTRLPIVLTLNCLNSYFYDPDPTYRGLGESMILNPSGGAVAFIGSTTATAPVAQTALAQGLFTKLGTETKDLPKTLRLGDLFLHSKLGLSAAKMNQDTIGSYTLLGDPSMKIPTNAFAEPTPPSDSNGAEPSDPSPTSPPIPPSPGSPSGGGGGGGGGVCGGISADFNQNSQGGVNPWITVLLMLIPLILRKFLLRREVCLDPLS